MKSLKPLPSYEDVAERLSYNPKKGEFTYLLDVSNIKAGTKTKGCLSQQGYFNIQFDGKTYRSHQLAYLLHYKEAANCMIDHINGDKGDNRIKNLRKSNHSLNGHNRQDVKGYYWREDRQMFAVQITIDGITKSLGHYKTEAEASAAYKGAKKLLGLDK